MWKRAQLSRFTVLCLHTKHKREAHTTEFDLVPFYFILYFIYFFEAFFVCLSVGKEDSISVKHLSVTDKHFLITIATRMSVFFEVAGKVKRAATMRSSYSLCSLRPLLFICIWVTDGCLVCVGQSPGGWQRVEGRRVGGFHGQKLEANGKCKTFWGFSLFFFHSASICCRLVLAPSPTCLHAPDPLGSC